MPKLRAPTLSPAELRTRQFQAAIAYGRTLKGIRTQDAFAAALGISRQALYYHEKHDYETMSMPLMRRMVSVLELSRDVVGNMLGCKD